RPRRRLTVADGCSTPAPPGSTSGMAATSRPRAAPHRAQRDRRRGCGSAAAFSRSGFRVPCDARGLDVSSSNRTGVHEAVRGDGMTPEPAPERELERTATGGGEERGAEGPGGESGVRDGPRMSLTAEPTSTAVAGHVTLDPDR